MEESSKEKRRISRTKQMKSWKSEFRTYGKLNCNLFDLISGNLEPKQTKALGFLLSKSPLALKIFLKLIDRGKCPNGKKLQFNRYIVNCEALDEDSDSKNGDRIDILLRFYDNYSPVQAIIIEAKSVSLQTSQKAADEQVEGYTREFPYLKEFRENIRTVTLTRNVIQYDGFSIPLSWSELIDSLYACSKSKTSLDERLINDFVGFILNIKGSMNYFDEEILSISAGKTYAAVMQTGIYECPVKYPDIKKVLYMAFRKSKKNSKDKESGTMEALYKVKSVYELSLYDDSAIDDINRVNPDFKFKDRLDKYKSLVKRDCKVKRVYLLDTENMLDMPYKVRPVENNSNRSYYSMSDFLACPNSNLDDKTIVVAKNISVENNKVVIAQSKKKYVLQTEFGQVQSPVKIDSGSEHYKLNPNEKYVVVVQTVAKSTDLKCIRLYFDEDKHKWQLHFEYKL